jgi:hypothetical protein
VPIGRSLARKFVKVGETRGVKAKTVYPPMPARECWEPDKVFAESQAGLLNAKSIGWLPTKANLADVKDGAKNRRLPSSATVSEKRRFPNRRRKIWRTF